MEDMRYDQYGAPMGYQPMEKQQGGYMNRNIPVGRYGNMNSGMVNQGRMPNQQQMNMMDQQKQGPVMNSVMGDRSMQMGNRDDMDGGYPYRPTAMGMNPRNQMTMDGMDPKGQLLRKNSSGPVSSMNSYSTASSKPTSGMSEYSNNHVLYRFFPSVFSPSTNTIGESFYSLPTSFLFPTPAISNDQIQKFSTNLLLFIFYLLPNDKLQVLAAQELYNRDLVYHKVNSHWYRKSSSNYASCKCCEVFDLESFTFVTCEEDHKNRDMLSVSELQDCIKKWN